MHKIAFDVMGSDKGLIPAINAGLHFLQNHHDVEIFFVGNQKAIENHLATVPNCPKNYQIIDTPEVIGMDGGIMDIRRKPDSSLVKALELVKNKSVDGMLTGGSSAAFIAGAHFILGEFEGVGKPGFMPTWPTIVENHTVLFLDAGANTDNSAQDLYNFAKMATIYAQTVLHQERPRVSLLNIGEEKSKGKDVHREAYELLKADQKLNFQGNIEAREMISGSTDIIVTDGFSGNIALKAMEGALKNLMKVIKTTLTKSLIRKIPALFLKKAFKEVGTKFDYKNYAGAILLGVNGVVFKSHGSSDEQAFGSTLRMTYEAIQGDVLAKIKTKMEVES
ncbi:phosphate:acyl-[acyl carrier protein] acyltransferase [Entomoplasma freundtii]|uniref:Phosphate acyltransferase n=1 Tax=Entomoplasma freundtii TaxID=74700 RepID=A0A2K8NUF3_9MOLU|nr:phosphate acyltransferase PlsX [Entomoplasma freundtii]ATZ16253.1 glycerol-3-phosphate acyltransferase PlsX [Entomoplasma freundtii]TDY56846.1 phosphate:acyl-[acyl carrier protein] acyltransferase [Entomoplasma freundtii]